MKVANIAYLLGLSACFTAALPTTDSEERTVVTLRYNEKIRVKVPIRLLTFPNGQLTTGMKKIKKANIFHAEIEEGPDSVRCFFERGHEPRFPGDNLGDPNQPMYRLTPVPVTKAKPFFNPTSPLADAVGIECRIEMNGMSEREQEAHDLKMYNQDSSNEPVEMSEERMDAMLKEMGYDFSNEAGNLGPVPSPEEVRQNLPDSPWIEEAD